MCPDDAADLFRYDLFTKQCEKFGTFSFVVAQPFKLPIAGFNTNDFIPDQWSALSN